MDTRLEEAEKLMQSGLFDRAEILIKDILYEEPDNLEALCDLGISLSESGKGEAARKTLEYYLKHDGCNPDAWEALGCTYLKEHNLEEAEICLNKALELKSGQASILRNLAVLYSLIRKPSKSYELLVLSKEKNPLDFRTLYALSYAHMFYNKNEDAQNELKLLLSLDIPEVFRKSAEINLVRLQAGWDMTMD